MDLSSQIRAHEAAHLDELRRIRSLSLEERAAMLDSVCELAAEIMASRRAAGMPPVRPAPWPPSTLEFLRQHAPNARRRKERG
jgi:hypothetical protein